MRLFTALWPPVWAIEALRADLESAGADWPPEGWRASPVDQWHVTLCFHGDDGDPGVLARSLDARAARCVAPRLRLAGAGWFARVTFAAVQLAEPADRVALAELVSAAGGDPDDYTPHVTVARSRRRDAGSVAAGPTGSTGEGPLHRHRGPWWQPTEVLLVQSSGGGSQTRYRVMHRVALLDRPAPGGRPHGW